MKKGEELLKILGIKAYTQRHLSIINDFLVNNETDLESLLNQLGNWDEEDFDKTKKWFENIQGLKLEQTQRGFDIGYFNDRNKVECSLQKSSIATEDCIWLGANRIELKEFINGKWIDRTEFDNGTMKHHYIANNRMHLNREQVKNLLPYLQKFVETGNLL